MRSAWDINRLRARANEVRPHAEGRSGDQPDSDDRRAPRDHHLPDVDYDLLQIRGAEDQPAERRRGQKVGTIQRDQRSDRRQRAISAAAKGGPVPKCRGPRRRTPSRRRRNEGGDRGRQRRQQCQLSVGDPRHGRCAPGGLWPGRVCGGASNEVARSARMEAARPTFPAAGFAARHWYRLSPVSVLLFPISLVFRLLVALRRLLFRAGALPSVRIHVPVIVVGNLTVGGTGKTPLVLALVETLRAKGLSPGILSRGHGRSDTGPRAVSEGDDAAQVGDEPLLLAERSG